MTSAENRVSDEIVEKASEAYCQASFGIHTIDEWMRAALEAVWPEPMLTREEAHIAAQAIDQWLDEDGGGLQEKFPTEASALESALEKLEEHGV